MFNLTFFFLIFISIKNSSDWFIIHQISWKPLLYLEINFLNICICGRYYSSITEPVMIQVINFYLQEINIFLSWTALQKLSVNLMHCVFGCSSIIWFSISSNCSEYILCWLFNLQLHVHIYGQSNQYFTITTIIYCYCCFVSIIDLRKRNNDWSKLHMTPHGASKEKTTKITCSSYMLLFYFF